MNKYHFGVVETKDEETFNNALSFFKKKGFVWCTKKGTTFGRYRIGYLGLIFDKERKDACGKICFHYIDDIRFETQQTKVFDTLEDLYVHFLLYKLGG